MTTLGILLGTSSLLFIILVALFLVSVFKPSTKTKSASSTRSDLEKIKAQIED